MKAKVKIYRAGTFVVPVCVECNKELDENEIVITIPFEYCHLTVKKCTMSQSASLDTQ